MSILIALGSAARAADCNGNGREDGLDLAIGASEDCNANDVPDECEGFPMRFVVDPDSLPLGEVPRAFRALDIDADGDVDAIAAGRDGRGTSSFFVLRNAGDGRLEAAERITAGENVSHFDAGDLDDDGLPEIVSANGANLRVTRGVGEGAITIREEPFPGPVRLVRIVDVDGDSNRDVLALLETDAIAIALNDGDGGLSVASHDVGDGPTSLATGDIDGDGRVDIAIANGGSANVSTLLGAADGDFVPGPTLELADPSPTSLAAADFDFDERLDLAVASPTSLVVHFGAGDGTFDATSRLDASGVSLRALDLDGDGDVDLALASREPQGVTILLNAGSRVFSRRVLVVAGRLLNAIEFGDLDGDGDIDGVGTSPGPSSVVVLRGGGDGLLLRRSTVPLDGCENHTGVCAPHTGALLDLDGDGALDMIGANNFPGSFSIAMNRGDGTLVQTRNHVFGGKSQLSTAAGDLDGDDRTDAVTVDNVENVIRVHRVRKSDGTDNGEFESPVTHDVDLGPISVALADLDGDGDLDVVTANQSGGTASVLFNRGDGTLLRLDQRDFRVGDGPRAVAVADLNGDDRPDLVIAASGASQVTILLNDGAGAFPERLDVDVRDVPAFVVAGDLDADGDDDVVSVSGIGTSATVLLNTDGVLVAAGRHPIVHSPYSAVLADIDGDGALDLLTANEATSTVSILRGDGRGGLGVPAHHAVGDGLRFALAGDLDNDGDIDITTIDRRGKSFTVLSNDSSSDDGSDVAPDFRESICVAREFHELSALTRAGDRFVKFIAPARDDPTLMPLVFQNSARWALHQDFLSEVFDERFPSLDATEYTALVGARATRDYFAGSLTLLATPSGPLWGFDVFADFVAAEERLQAEEVGMIWERLAAAFRLDGLAYAPSSLAAIDVASSWTAPSFPIYLGGRPMASSFEAYTRGVGFGRVRILDSEELARANATGGLGFQDVLVLDRDPRDLEGVVAAVVTALPQGELSHLAVRTSRRGTPNAFRREAIELMTPFEGELVRVEVTSDELDVRLAALNEAEQHWRDSRPRLSSPPRVDADYAALEDLEAIAAVATGDGRDVAVSRFGGKATNLALLQSILTGENARYREPGFAIPARHYVEFMRENRIASAFDSAREVSYEGYLAELFADERFRSDSAFRFDALAGLREHARDESAVPGALARQIALRVAQVFGTTTDRVRFRSSSNVEDSPEFNGAGLYDSTSGCAADDLDSDTVGPSRCDLTESDERGIARALRSVWSSLWSFRAFEEREYYQIEQDLVTMAVLVTRAFVDERVNGVAFTGNPASAFDDRFVVVAQVGEESVVSPTPGVTPEKSLLDIVDGSVREIVRARGSSLLPEGVRVLADARLRELGALLIRVDDAFPLDPIPDGARVLHDVEFKIESNGDLAIKQVRPFLVAASDEPTPSFELVIPEGTELCGGFDISRDPRAEYELETTLRLRPGRHALPTDRASFALTIVDEIRLGPERALLDSLSDGRVTVTRFPAANGLVTHRFRYGQDFRTPDGSELELSISLLDYESRRGEPLEPARTFDGELLSQVAIGGHLERDGANPVSLRYISCDFSALSAWRVRFEFAGGDRVVLEERHEPRENEDFGEAALVAAELAIGGRRIGVRDRWRLVYSAIRHNRNVRYWVVFGAPIAIEGLARPAGAIELVAPDERNGVEAGARYLDVDFQPIGLADTIDVTGFSRGEPRFRRGDVDGSSDVDLTDPLVLLDALFRGAPAPSCPDAADANDDGRTNLTDAVVVLEYLFRAGPEPRAPFGECGTDPTADALGCVDAPSCEQ